MTAMLLPVILIISIIGGWIISKQAFAPVEKNNSDGKLDKRRQRPHRAQRFGGPSGIALFKHLDGMFDRLSARFPAEKQFTSDASHELRTPDNVISKLRPRKAQGRVTREISCERLTLSGRTGEPATAFARKPSAEPYTAPAGR